MKAAQGYNQRVDLWSLGVVTMPAESGSCKCRSKRNTTEIEIHVRQKTMTQDGDRKALDIQTIPFLFFFLRLPVEYTLLLQNYVILADS